MLDKEVSVKTLPVELGEQRFRIELACSKHNGLVFDVPKLFLVFEVDYRDFPFKRFVSLHSVNFRARPMAVVGAGVYMLVVLYKVAYYFRVVIFIGFIVYRVIVQSCRTWRSIFPSRQANLPAIR